MYHVKLNKRQNNIEVEKIEPADELNWFLLNKEETVKTILDFPEMSVTYINCFPHDFK